MGWLPVKSIIVLLTCGSVAHPCVGFDNKGSGSASEIWPSKCQPLPSKPKPPNFEDLTLDEILPIGVNHMNLITRNNASEATFVFGNVGEGKSSVIPLILGDMDKLNVGLGASNSSVIYRNENTIGRKGIPYMLKSLLPDYFVSQSDNFGQAAFWDFPGFNNSRGPKADIAQLYFLKHALGITKSAKFIFTIAHSSVMSESGVNMLATFATSLLKDAGKLKESIGVVVTEVNTDNGTGEEEVLTSIRNSLRSYVENEKNHTKQKRGNGLEANDTNQVLQRIGFIEGLMEENEKSTGNRSRIYFINRPDVCGAQSNMSAVWDTVAKLKLLHFSILKHASIVPEDFGMTLKTETLQKIKQVLWAKEINGVAKYTIETSKGIIKELERTLLGSTIKMPTHDLINEFKNSFNRHFGGMTNRGHANESSASGQLDSVNNDIDFFMSCASQRMKTIRFFREVMAEVYAAVPLSALSQPFQIAGSKLNSLTEFYNFCNETYHTLGEYAKQVFLRDLKNKTGLIQVDEQNVLDFLASAEINVTVHIRSMWQNQLDGQSKKYLVDLVRKQMPEIRVDLIYSRDEYDYGCRLNFIGRNVMFSEVIDSYIKHANGYCTNEINIEAVEKVYINRQIERADLVKYLHIERSVSSFKISVMAPVWVVIPTETGENRQINMNGLSDFSDWHDGSGGLFFGVYSKIINHKELFISANEASSQVHICGLATSLGYIHLASTSINENIRIEACPGSNRRGLVSHGYRPTYMPSHAIASYSAEFIRTSLLDCISSQSEEFFDKIASYAEFTEMELANNPLALATELETLEQEYFAKANNIFNCPGKMKRRMAVYYERTYQLIKKLLVNANMEDNVAYTWIGSLVIGRLISSRRLGITLNVINTEEYLAAVENDLIGLEKLEHKVAINKERENYNNALDEKVKESEGLIETTVRPAIAGAEAMIGEMNKKLLSTLDAFLTAAEEAAEDARKRKKEFETALPLKHFMSALSIIGTACTFLGPVGVIANGAIMAVTSVGNSFLDGKPSLGAIPKFTKQLSNLTDTYVQAKIDELSPTSTPAPTGNDKEIEDLKATKKAVAKVANAVTLGVGALDSVLGVVGKIQSDNAQLRKLEMAVQEAEEQVNGIKNLKEDFHKHFVPGLDAITDRISAETSNLNGTSQSGLIVKKFQMKKMLKDMQSMVKGFAGWISDAQKQMKDNGGTVLGERDVYENFLGSIATLDMALLVLFELYNQIEMYQERKELANFIANVNSPTTGELEKISNVTLRDALTRVSVSIKINLAVEEYKKAEHAFKQWVFPFPSYFLKSKMEIDFMKSKSFTEVVSSCRKELSRFRSDLRKSNAVVSVPDQFLYRSKFTSDAVSTRPFYVWSNEKWQDSIRRLFRGEPVQLKADVDMIGQENAKFFSDKTAIKFKYINIFIKARDPSLQAKLDMTLNNYRMLMTHSGVSIYKVNGEHFVMRDKAHTYSYNFEKNIATNVLKYKVEGPNSDILLSPYTWWTLSMRRLSDVGNENLEQFVSQVDLVLEGEGTYLDEFEATPGFLSDLNLSEYYETYEPSGDEILTSGEIPMEPLQRRCGPTLSFQPRPTPPASNFSQAILGGNQKQSVNTTKDKNCSYDTRYFTLKGDYWSRFDTNSSRNALEDYLKAMGYSEDTRAEILALGITVIISEVNNITYNVKTGFREGFFSQDKRRLNMTFQLGEEFETLLYDGRMVNNTFTLNKEKLSAMRIIKMKDFEATNEFKFSNGGFNVTLKAKDAEALLQFYIPCF